MANRIRIWLESGPKLPFMEGKAPDPKGAADILTKILSAKPRAVTVAPLGRKRRVSHKRLVYPTTMPSPTEPKKKRAAPAAPVMDFSQELVKHIIGRGNKLPAKVRADSLVKWADAFGRVLKELNKYYPGGEMPFISLIEPLGYAPSTPRREKAIIDSIRAMTNMSTDRVTLKDRSWRWAQPVVIVGDGIPEPLRKVGVKKILFPVVAGKKMPTMTLYGIRQVLGEWSGVQAERMILSSIQRSSDRKFKENFNKLVNEMIEKASWDWGRAIEKAIMRRDKDKVIVPLKSIQDRRGNTILFLNNFGLELDFTDEPVTPPEEAPKLDDPAQASLDDLLSRAEITDEEI